MPSDINGFLNWPIMTHTQNLVHTCWSRTRFQLWLAAGLYIQKFNFVVCGTGEELSMTATNHKTNLAYQWGNPWSISAVHHDDRHWQRVHGLSGFWNCLKRYALCAVRKKMKDFVRLKAQVQTYPDLVEINYCHFHSFCNYTDWLTYSLSTASLSMT